MVVNNKTQVTLLKKYLEQSIKKKTLQINNIKIVLTVTHVLVDGGESSGSLEVAAHVNALFSLMKIQ